jgi:hypothetical protein
MRRTRAYVAWALAMTFIAYALMVAAVGMVAGR